MSIWDTMAADVADLIDLNSTSITIRRGVSELSAQTVRIERAGATGLKRRGDGTMQSTGRIAVLGTTSLDIQIGDRFNEANGVLYEVSFVRPNRLACVQAEAEAVE